MKIDMKKAKILIVDDDVQSLRILEKQLKKWGAKPLLACSGEEALGVLEKNSVDLVLSDQMMPNMNGLELMKKTKGKYNHIPFVIVTGHVSIRKAVDAIKQGADDYISKPYDMDQIHAAITRSLNYHRLDKENVDLKEHLREIYGFHNIITKSPIKREALKLAEKVSKIPNALVMIYGESGTGKEFIARAIHFSGENMGDKFVAINCASVPSGLMDSDLFGHEKGAFTGADSQRKGKFELAGKGTILLDEIGDMPLDLQAKLLRVLQERFFERLGSNEPVPVNCRVIVATHRNLNEMIKMGKFREDLFHRINFFPVTLPPLRETKEDISMLADYFTEQFRKESGKPISGISREAMDVLMNYPWPGNIRELKNCIERASILVEDGLIKPEHLIVRTNSSLEPDFLADKSGNIRMEISLRPEDFSFDNVVKQVLDLTLKKCGNNKSRAASLLKVGRKMFYRQK
jgi:DNA-binding NtrC family response regulator